MKTHLRALAIALAVQVATLALTGLQAGEIHDAVVAGDLARVKALLETDPTLLESKDDTGETPLVRACRALQVETAVFLMDRGANVNARNRYGASALFCATRHGHRKAAEALIGAGADQGALEEANYGKARQLDESLGQGEA